MQAAIRQVSPSQTVKAVWLMSCRYSAGQREALQLVAVQSILLTRGIYIKDLTLSSLSQSRLPTHSMRTAAHSVTAAVLRAWSALALIMSVWLKHRQDRVMFLPAGRLHPQAASRQERYTMPDSSQKCSLMENTGHPCLRMPPLKPSGYRQTAL